MSDNNYPIQTVVDKGNKTFKDGVAAERTRIRTEVEKWRIKAETAMNNGDGTAVLHEGGKHEAYRHVQTLLDSLNQ